MTRNLAFPSSRYTGSAATGLCLLAFAVASLSDPGTITKDNADAHQALFAYDGELFSPTRCLSCEFIKPARSKHCSTCNR